MAEGNLLSDSSRKQELKYRAELRRLYQNDYGAPIEFIIRLVGTLLGAVFIERYTGWAFVWLWLAAFVFLQAVYFVSLRSFLGKTRVRKRHLVIAQSIFLLILGSFASVPAIMMASSDDALSISGFFIFGSALVFLVRRSESSLALTFTELGVFTIVVSLSTISVWSRQTDELASFGILFAFGFFVFYLGHNSYLIRRRSLLAEKLSERSTQSQKMEAIGKLAGGVAHDFNNALTAIIGNLDLIEETDDPDLKREFLDNARQSARQSAGVVSQMLIYSRKNEVQQEEVEVESLLEDVRKLSRTLVPAHVTIEFHKPEERLCVNIDPSLFVAALLNLIKNGADAMGGVGSLHISANISDLQYEIPCLGGPSLPPATYVSFLVIDEGTGITSEEAERAIEPFFTTKPVGSGSGMGLSMVTGFAARSGGGLRMLGSCEGTTVELLLPLLARAG